MHPLILPSARRHGISDRDILHAHRNVIGHFPEDDMVMLIGPDERGNLLEVGVSKLRPGRQIVHAMTARQKYLSRL